MQKAVTKQSAKEKMADIRKGKKSAPTRRTQAKRKSRKRSSLKSTYIRYSSRAVLESFVALFAYQLPKDWGKDDKKKKTEKGGRPTVINQQVLGKLETAFAIDCTVEEACILAGINPTTYYDFIKKQPEFSKTIELLRNVPFLLARQTIVDGIMNNYAQAMDYMSRKRKIEFSHKLELSHEGGIKHTHDISSDAKKAVDNIFTLFEKKAREVAPSVTVKDDDV